MSRYDYRRNQYEMETGHRIGETITDTEQLTQWLESHKCENVRQCGLFIGEEKFSAATYVKDGLEVIYAIGQVPKAYRKRAKTVFRFEGDKREWYITCYMPAKNLTREFAPHHPFGETFQLSPWQVPSGEPIDRYNYWHGEHKPYTRVDAVIRF